MSLKQKTVKGAAWNGVGNILKQALQIITLVILAHYLTPTEFGIYALLMIFIGFLNQLSAMGAAQAVIQISDLSDTKLTSILYFNIFIGVLFYASIYFSAPLIAIFFANPELELYLRIMGIVFIILAMGSIHKAMIERGLDFKSIVIVETIAIFISSVAAICAALIDLGVLSLIIMHIIQVSFMTLGYCFLYRWRPGFSFKLAHIKEVWSFSINLSGFSIINYFSRQADHFLIGKFIGETGLGIYSLAYKVMLYPLQNITFMLNRVLFPAFSTIKEDNQRFKRGYVKAICLIALITFPIMSGLTVVAENFVLVVFGEEWHEMTYILIILAPVGLMQTITSTTGSIYMAKGNTKQMLRISVVFTVITVIGFLLGLPYGINGVATAYAMVNLVLLTPLLHFAWSQIDLKTIEGLKPLVPYLICSIMMATIVYFAGSALESNFELELIYILIIQIFCGIFTYILLLAAFKRKDLFKLINSLRNR